MKNEENKSELDKEIVKKGREREKETKSQKFLQIASSQVKAAKYC